MGYSCLGKGAHFETYKQFIITLLRNVFDHSPDGKEVSEQLFPLRQGKSRVSEYALEFCRNFSTSCPSPMAQRKLPIGARMQRLSSFPRLTDLDIDLDNLTQDRGRRTYTERSQYRKFQCLDVTGPTQLGRAHLTRAERERRKTHGLCLYCGNDSHSLLDYMERPRPGEPKIVHGESHPSQPQTVSNPVISLHKPFKLDVLILHCLMMVPMEISRNS